MDIDAELRGTLGPLDRRAIQMYKYLLSIFLVLNHYFLLRWEAAGSFYFLALHKLPFQQVTVSKSFQTS